MACKFDAFQPYFKRVRFNEFTPRQKEQLKDLDQVSMSHLVGVINAADERTAELIGKVVSLKPQQFAAQTEKGRSLADLQLEAVIDANKLIGNLTADQRRTYDEAARAILASRKKGEVLGRAEQEAIMPYVINVQKRISELPNEIRTALEAGNDNMLNLLQRELASHAATMQQFLGNANAASVQLNYLKKIKEQIRNGKAVLSIFGNGAC